MSATATPPRSSRRQAMTSAPPSPYADTGAANGSPLRRSRGFATNLSSCAGEEGAAPADSPTFHLRKGERLGAWRAAVQKSPYTPQTHSALARAIDSGDESDDNAGGRARPIAPPVARVLVPPGSARTPPPSAPRAPPASGAGRDLSTAFTLSPPQSSPLSARPLKPRLRPALAEPMRRYNSLPTPPTHWSPSRVPRSIGLYDLNLHATPPRSKYQPQRLDLGGPLTPAPESPEER